ncbi:MAG: SURF1 family protein [Candidatus Thiodiazotropha sp.]
MSHPAAIFRPQAIPTVIVVILLPLFTGLGTWQLERAEQKRQLAASLETRRKLPALSLNRGVPDAGEREFRHISVDGRYLPEHTVLIEHRKHLGQSGLHVITPLRISGSHQVVLINRGWIARENLAHAASLPTPLGIQRVSGIITLPQPPAMELDFSDSADPPPPRWPFLTLDHFASWSGLELLPFAVLQSPGENGGFVRQWPQPQISDAMHIGYAIQWFAFALIAFFIWLRLSLAKPIPKEASL